MRQRRSQNGVALVLVLILLGVGGLVMAPSLRLTSTALNFFGISRESTEVAYALDAVTQQALWMLENDAAFQDCDPNADFTAFDLDGTDDKFKDCVAMWGSWDLATADLLETKPNESKVDAVNGQQVIVTVQVPGALGAPPEPTPIPNNTQCLYTSVTRTPTWVQVGEPITYTFHIKNCGDKNFFARRVKAIFPGSFIYTATATNDSAHPLFLGDPVSHGDPSPALSLDERVPEEIFCDGAVTLPDPDYFPCAIPGEEITDGSLLLNWPAAQDTFGNFRFNNGDEWDWVFQVTPTTWGVFYVEAVVCYFSNKAGNQDPGPCEGGERDTKRSGKVAPVVAGMFNIQGNGKGNAFGASSKLDGSGADLISEQPQ